MKPWKLFVLLCPALALAPATAAAQTSPPVQLARSYADQDPRHYWISEKLDGVRAYWTGTELLTRSGRRIPAPADFTHGWPERPLDGELWLGRGRFEAVTALLQSHPTPAGEWRAARYLVFDLPDEPGSFDQRLRRLRELLPPLHDSTSLRLVDQFRVASPAELRARLEQVVAAGGEGLILHHAQARHRIGRSDALLKLKPFDDAEARVIAHLPGQGRYAGMLGALLVETDSGLRFRIGSGFSDAQRRNPPAPGSWVTYRHNGLTARGTPRFARFLRPRPVE